jgi:hypothetical protein
MRGLRIWALAGHRPMITRAHGCINRLVASGASQDLLNPALEKYPSKPYTSTCQPLLDGSLISIDNDYPFLRA